MLKQLKERAQTKLFPLSVQKGYVRRERLFAPGIPFLIDLFLGEYLWWSVQ
jgi:hypothetical protein